MRRLQHAPKMGTILVAAALTAFAVVALFLTVLPATIAGFATLTLGIYAAIAGVVLLLLGIFLEGL
jgi:hypothetical protein